MENSLFEMLKLQIGQTLTKVEVSDERIHLHFSSEHFFVWRRSSTTESSANRARMQVGKVMTDVIGTEWYTTLCFGDESVPFKTDLAESEKEKN